MKSHCRVTWQTYPQIWSGHAGRWCKYFYFFKGSSICQPFSSSIIGLDFKFHSSFFLRSKKSKKAEEKEKEHRPEEGGEDNDQDEEQESEDDGSVNEAGEEEAVDIFDDRELPPLQQQVLTQASVDTWARQPWQVRISPIVKTILSVTILSIILMQYFFLQVLTAWKP